MDMFDFAGMLFGGSRASADATTVTATGAGASDGGEVGITLDADVTPAEDTGEGGDTDQTIIDLPTSPDVDEGDELIVTLVGDGPLKTPVVTANPGSGDRMRALVNAAQAVADAAQAVAEAVNQHFFADTNGIHVTEATQEDWDESHTGANVLINALGQLFRDGLNNLLTLTTENGARALTIWDGLGNSASNILARFSSNGISFADGTSFDIGDSSSYIHFDGNGHINIGGSGLTVGGYIQTGGVTVSDLTQAAQDATLNSNISVGGRNLLRNTGNPVASDFALTRATVADGVITVTPTTSSAYAKFKVDYLDFDDYGEGEFTVSFDAKAVSGATYTQLKGAMVYLGFNVPSRIGNTLSTSYDRYTSHTMEGVLTYDWVRYSHTFVVPDDLTSGKATALASGSNLTVQFAMTGSYAPMQVRNVKLEKGNKATDWTPAPEDVDAAITNAAKTATSYVTEITGQNGIMVHPSTDQTTGVQITSDVDILRDGTSVINIGTMGDTNGTTDAGVTIYDGNGNDDSNVLARFTGNRIRLGKHIDDNEENDGAYVDFFDGDWFVNRLDSNVFVRDDPNDPARTLSLGMSTAIEGTFPGTKAFIDASFGASAQVYGDELGAHEQITRSSLSSGTSGRYSSTSMGVVTTETYGVVDGYQERTGGSRQAYIHADELELTYDVGQFATTRTHSIEHVSVVLRSPVGTYTGTNTTATASASGWQLTYFNTVVAEVGSPRTYDYSFSNGVLTATRDCVLEISGVMNWTDSIAGNRGFGVFSGTAVGSGTEHSAFQNFSSSVSNRKSVVFPPKLFTLTSGSSLTFGRYQQASAIYQNGTNYSWVTIKVIE